MVQFQQWQTKQLLQSSPGNIDVEVPFRWIGQTGGAPDETRHVWPFDATNWKGHRVIIYNQNQFATTTWTRQLNGVDVGTALVLGANDPPGPFPVVFIDLSIVAVVKGDRVGFRWKSSVESGVHPVINATSYFEFADGLWGF